MSLTTVFCVALSFDVRCKLPFGDVAKKNTSMHIMHTRGKPPTLSLPGGFVQFTITSVWKYSRSWSSISMPWRQLKHKLKNCASIMKGQNNVLLTSLSSLDDLLFSCLINFLGHGLYSTWPINLVTTQHIHIRIVFLNEVLFTSQRKSFPKLLHIPRVMREWNLPIILLYWYLLRAIYCYDESLE